MPGDGETNVQGTGTASNANNQQGVSGEGGNNPGQSGNNIGWRAGLPTELRDHEAFRDKGTVGDLAREYLSLKESAGNTVAIPGEGSTPEEVAAFRERLGVPKNPEDYKISGSEDGEFDSQFSKLALQVGLTAEQAQKLHGELFQYSKAKESSLLEQAAQARKASEDKLKAEWGSSFEKNDAAARRFLMLAGPELTDALGESGVLEDARVRRSLFKLSQIISEDALVNGRGQGTQRSTGWNFPNTPNM